MDKPNSGKQSKYLPSKVVTPDCGDSKVTRIPQDKFSPPELKSSTAESSPDCSRNDRSTGPFNKLKRQMRRLFGNSPVVQMHKSLQELPTEEAATIHRKYSSTENSIEEFTGRHSHTQFLTSDVPQDASEFKKAYEDAMIQLTSLTDEEIDLIRNSWVVLKSHIERIGVIVFLGIFEEHEDFRDAFSRFRGKQLTELSRDPALQSHGLRVLNVVDKLISRLNRIELFEGFILSLGSRHCKYVPSIKMIPTVGNQLLEVIKPVLLEGDLWNAESEKGWKAVTTFLTCAMCYGLARNCRT